MTKIIKISFYLLALTAILFSQTEIVLQEGLDGFKGFIDRSASTSHENMADADYFAVFHMRC